MKIYDMHIHSQNIVNSSSKLLDSMSEAGVYGGCVFSNPPLREDSVNGTSFEERVAEVLKWSSDSKGRIFPVLRIHPYEENIFENVKKAAEAGIVAFKFIASDYYVYEERPMALFREIAKLGKPIIFHTGILWNGGVSSSYNRPLNWEALIDIEGLRFSMGHCSWPWIDECIALYGKFLNAHSTRGTAEMFLDITPGTPEIYRRELLSKLYTLGYDVGDNLLFGTDGIADNYKAKWTKFWLDTDRKILDELGVSLENREKLYSKNLMRFLGITNEVHTSNIPTIDDSDSWSCRNPQVTEIIKKWYNRLGFPKEFNAQFKKALNTIPISDAITYDTYDTSCEDGARNLLSYLFFAENLSKRYQERGIPESILLDSLSDVVTWTKSWSTVKNTLYLGELDWLGGMFSMNLFKLGRLQFCRGKAYADCTELGLKKGDNVIDVHIPAGDRFLPEDCDAAIKQAKEFFATYFPNYEYKYFACHSWLLDRSLNDFLTKDSNIIKFGERFIPVLEEESNAILRYVFTWDTNIVNLAKMTPNSSFAERVKKAALKGYKFHETYGIFEK